MNKILIITPPDHFYGNIKKSLLINPTAEEKSLVQEWFKDNDLQMAIFVYNNNDNLSWLLNTTLLADSVYFNIDNTLDESYNYVSYLTANPKVTYKSNNVNYSLLNQNRTYDINEYIQRNWLD